MKICIDASRYGHETATGVERYSFYIINGLIEKVSKQKDHKLVLCSREPIKLPKDIIPNEERVKIKVIPRKRFWTQLGLAAEMKQHPPDRLFIPSHTLPRIHPKQSIITIHDVAFKHLKKSYSLSQYLHQDLSTRFACKNAAKIIVPSKCTRDDLVRYYNCPAGKIYVVPHGYEPLPDLHMPALQEDAILEQFGLSSDSKFVFFIGRLETKKNIENLLKAFSEFVKIHKEWKLLLGGKRGIGFKGILKIANDLKLWNNIVMPGYIRDVEKHVLFKNCMFFVFPSLYEGFGFPVLEAFSYGKPVLTSRVSAIPEVAGDAAMYTDPFDYKAMSNDIEKLAMNDTLRKNLIKAGYEQLQKFHWDTAIEKTWKILTE